MSDVTVDAELAQVPGHPQPPAQLPITDIPQWMEQPHFYLQIETIICYRIYIIYIYIWNVYYVQAVKDAVYEKREKYLPKEEKKTLPQLRESDGFNNKQYMMFKFRHTVGCRSTGSDIHTALSNPPPKILARMEERSFGAGWKFMYPYALSDMTIHDVLKDHNIDNTVNMHEEERLKRYSLMATTLT